MNKNSISEILINLRGNKTQREVAESLGISVSALSMYETGQRIPRDEVKVKMANYYDKPVQDIFLNKKYTPSDNIIY